jgi:hypothetical protein
MWCLLCESARPLCIYTFIVLVSNLVILRGMEMGISC